SSRRRHTRSDRDWSSDVCSSDLYSVKVTRIRCENRRVTAVETTSGEQIPASVVISNSAALNTYLQLLEAPPAKLAGLQKLPLQRSEERRVGKECRCRRGG